MKTRILFLFFSLGIVVQHSIAQTDTILNRYTQYLWQSVKVESNIKQITTTLDSNGQWSDLNYKDTEPANWQLLIHLKRVKDMALAYSNPHSPFYEQQLVKNSINAALDHWLKARYKSSNWWHNEIGVPQQMRDIIILLQAKLSSAQSKGALEVLSQYHLYDNTVGANLTWSADLGFHYGLLTGNQELMQKCRDLMVKEIKITTGEGVQPDYSFHQHGSRLQMYQYGKAFLWENVRVAWQLHGTSFAFPQEKIDILTDFVLQGWQWMARGIHAVPGTMDRSSSRKNELHSPDIRELLPYLIALAPAKKDSLSNVLRNQNGIGALTGFRYYPYSDFAAYHQKNFSFFLKTISERTLTTESINNENLKGHLLNSGDAYLIRDGEEYYNLMPVWNWEYLPGVTAFKGADKIKRQSFAGSVSNGRIGLTSMDYLLLSKDEHSSLRAQKSWFCVGDKIICLIAGLKGGHLDTAYTALDQCRWQGDVIVNKQTNKITEGDHLFTHLKWIYHSGFGYIPLGETSASVQLHTSTGSWKTINGSETGETPKEKVFMPVLLHEGLRNSQPLGYMLAYCKNSGEAEKLSKKPPCKIVRNDSTCQSVSFEDGTLMASFFQPTSVNFKNVRLSVDRPCLILIINGILYASDPFQNGGTLSLVMNNKNHQLQLNKNGFSTNIKVQQ
jgi:chondroitin AC lyase